MGGLFITLDPDTIVEGYNDTSIIEVNERAMFSGGDATIESWQDHINLTKSNNVTQYNEGTKKDNNVYALWHESDHVTFFRFIP